jgi:2'-5' RNA ligase
MGAMTTIVAPTPFVGQAVESLRFAYDWSAGRGVPAHVTLLGPFLGPDEVTTEVQSRLRRVFAPVEPLHLSLSELRMLGNAACLVPEITNELAALTSIVHDAWPNLSLASRRYHVTVARSCTSATFRRIENAVRPMLPLCGDLTKVLLLERCPDGQVTTLATFPLAA